MLLGREYKKVTNDTPMLTIFHWNVLSDQLSGFFPAVNDKYLDWSYRHPKIAADLIQSDADIMCLSEVDHFEDFYQPLLNSKGYSCLYKKKRGWHSDGLCIAYKTNKFVLCGQRAIYFPRSNQFALIAELSIGTLRVLVISTHLKSGARHESDRERQIKYLLDGIEKNENLAIVLCGDFNCEPLSPTYNRIINSGFQLKSAYYGNLIENAEPEITTYKKREEIEYKTIDYIFLKGLVVADVLKLPELKDIEIKGMPSEDYPSDHFSLMCRVSQNFQPML